MNMNTEEAGAEDLREPQLKNFSVRNIPPKIHHMWKVTAALHGVSMEKLALIAIRDYCKDQLAEVRDILADSPPTTGDVEE